MTDLLKKFNRFFASYTLPIFISQNVIQNLTAKQRTRIFQNITMTLPIIYGYSLTLAFAFESRGLRGKDIWSTLHYHNMIQIKTHCRL